MNTSVQKSRSLINSSSGLIKSDLKDEHNDRQGEINVKVTVRFYLCNTSINKQLKYYLKRFTTISQYLTYVWYECDSTK